jgi:uncharacterized protein (TIGR03067 family)
MSNESITSPVIGMWQLVRAEFGGEETPELVVQQTTVEFTAASYRVRFAGRVVDRGTFELGGVVGTHTIVLRGVEGPNAGRTIPGVFQLRGDRLRVCYGINGIAPTEFGTSAGDERYLATYRRRDVPSI